jgi:KUP system potassium uptake protein
MVVTIGLVVFFESSDKLAAAYGIAVSLTMLMTTGLLFVAMREIWRWSLFSSAAIAMVFFVIDTSFLFANMIKVLEGVYPAAAGRSHLHRYADLESRD